MIELYLSPAPNGYKISIMLEEIELDYSLHEFDLAMQEHYDLWQAKQRIELDQVRHIKFAAA